MQIKEFLAVILVGANCIISNAEYGEIAGYKPGSKVTDHNAIDLDQLALEKALKEVPINYNLANAIYKQGGNSKAYAEFSVGKLPGAVKKKDKVKSESGIEGSMYSNYDKDVTTIKVAYPTSDTQVSYVNCKGGALLDPPSKASTAMDPYKLEKGCFNGTEKLMVDINGDGNFDVNDVTVTPTEAPVNKAGRTLQGFSTKALNLMYTPGSQGGCGGRAGDGCPYAEFSSYYNFYGVGDYADKIVLAALNAGTVQFQGKVAWNFAPVDGDEHNEERVQVIKKGTAYMNAYMYAIREFEDAIDDCNAGCKGATDTDKSVEECNALSTNAVHAWDEGVAFYTGSLEGATTGGKGDGKLSYRLAEKRCGNFKTCGDSMDQTTGTSYVNIELFKHLAQGNTKLLEGKCEDVRPILDNMTALMSIPLIQGTLRYAYKVGKQSGGATEKGEGAIFAAAIVPRVANCGAEDANTIMQHMQLGAATTDFEKVKTAFENNYACMKIDCKHVGGLWDADSNPPKYFAGAEPCGVAVPTTASPSDVSRAPSLVSPSLVLIAAAVALLPRALQ